MNNSDDDNGLSRRDFEFEFDRHRDVGDFDGTPKPLRSDAQSAVVQLQALGFLALNKA